MVFGQITLVLAILAVCSFGPGFYVVRRLNWGGLEKLCGAIALSLILLWLMSWSLYVFTPGWQAAGVISGVCAVLAAASWRETAALLRIARVRRAVLGYGFLLAWTLVLLGIIRNYSGAAWRGDWLEHFQRSLFFLHHFPVNTEIIGGYQLAARPPAMNVLAAFVMAQAGDRFEVFQVVFAFLNLLLFFPCAMALPMLARPRRPGILPLVGVFAASPVLMQNATYAWTKALPAFFVITAILLYLKGWRKGDPLRMAAAFVALGMGFLAHYSVGPYLGFLALHYLLAVFWKRRGKWQELAWIAGLGTGLLATWFAWSIAVYGVHTTFASNTSVTSSQQYQGHNLEKIAANLFDSAIPHLARDPAMARTFEQPNAWGAMRDHLFVIYQSNLIFCMGAIGGPAALWLLVSTLRKHLGAPGERSFWIGLIAWAVVVGIAVAGEREPLGLAHLTLVPMVALALTLVASRFTASRALAMAVVAGCAIDFTLGVFLHARIEHLENTADRTVFAGLAFADGQFRTAPPGDDALTSVAWENWMRKHQYRVTEDWSRRVDSFQPGDRTLDGARAEAHTRLDPLLAEDARLWRGWYRRHGGEIEYLGDHFGNGDAASVVLVLMFAGLLYRMTKTIPGKTRVSQVRHAKTARGRKRVRR